MNPKISIIVPIYKVEKFLHKCIDSILNQTFTDFELILVEDGSPDCCGETCDEYANKDKRIRVIHQKNSGISLARNAGLDIARGDYIGFVDGDDYINPYMYETLYKLIVEQDCDVSMCHYIKTESSEEALGKIEDKVEVEYYTNIEALVGLQGLKGRDPETFCVVWNKLFKRNLFDTLRFKPGKWYEDAFLMLYLYDKVHKVVYTHQPLYYYVQHEGSIMKQPYCIHSLDRIDVFFERMIFFRKLGFKELEWAAEHKYIERFFLLYFIAIEHGTDKEIMSKIYQRFRRNVVRALRNPLYHWKDKVAWIIFIISPKLYRNLLT